MLKKDADSLCVCIEKKSTFVSSRILQMIFWLEVVTKKSKCFAFNIYSFKKQNFDKSV